MNVALDLLILAGGLALLIGGAELLIRGASAIARRLGVPPLVIGLTIVAFGTSTPEVVVNVWSVAHGETGLAFGNIVGACAINVGFVLALTALLRPLTIESSVITREVPMLLLTVTALVVMSNDTLLGNPPDVLVRSDGILLLLLFGVFLYYTILGVVRRRRTDAFVEEVEQSVRDEALPVRSHRAWIDLAITIGGLVGVGAGGRLSVIGAVGVAEALGVPQVLIGLTLVSFGTTAPELTTCLLAARRGQSDIALGNIVGSNIFNLLFIGGACATIRSIPIPTGGHVDLLVAAGLSAALLPLAFVTSKGQLLGRGSGAILLIAYLSYVIWRVATTGMG